MTRSRRDSAFGRAAAPEGSTPVTQAGASPGLGDLSLGGRIVLAAARRWSHGATALSPCLIFQGAGVRHPAFAAFVGLLALLDTAGPGAPLFLEPGEDALSEGERGLIEALAALQQGEPWRSQRIIAGWLPPVAAPRAVALMAMTAAGLAQAGLRVAERRPPTMH